MMTTPEIIISALGGTMSLISSVVAYKIHGYLQRRDKEERLRHAKQELHYMKLDAVLYALGIVGVHRDEFRTAYESRLEELKKERHDVNELANI